jgi:hypothetical protein
MALPVYQPPPGATANASPMSNMLPSMMQSYSAMQQAQAQKQKNKMQPQMLQAQLDAMQTQTAGQQQMQPLQQQMMQAKMQAMQDQKRQQDYLSDRYSQIMQSNLPEDQKKQQISNLLASSGNIKGAASLMYPNQGRPTSYERNLQAGGYTPGTQEYQKAMQSMLERGLVPTNIKQARYAGNIAQSMIDRVNDENVMDAVKKFSGPGGALKRGAMGISGALGLYSDPDYIKFQTFVHQTVPALAAETRKLLGEYATETQNRELKKFTNPSSWSTSPEIIDARWKEYQKIHGDALRISRKSPLQLNNMNEDVSRETQDQDQYLSVKDGKVMGPDGKWYTAEELG